MAPLTTRPTESVPPKAKTAAVLFGAYGLLVLAGLLLVGFGIAGEGSGVVLLRILAIWIIAGGLWGGAGWAWLGGLLLPGLWLLLGTLSFVRFLAGDTPPPLPALLLFGAALLILAVGWGLLLTRDVRAAYR